MLSVFIPSYNRPTQLLALLESLQKYNNCLFENIHVRWAATNDISQKAYLKLLEHPICEFVNIKPKKGLSEDMLEVMSNPQYKYFNIITTKYNMIVSTFKH